MKRSLAIISTLFLVNLSHAQTIEGSTQFDEGFYTSIQVLLDHVNGKKVEWNKKLVEQEFTSTRVCVTKKGADIWVDKTVNINWQLKEGSNYIFYSSTLPQIITLRLAFKQEANYYYFIKGEPEGEIKTNGFIELYVLKKDEDKLCKILSDYNIAIKKK
jgi:hypothetical protein